MSMIQPFPLIEISGPPRERGRQYGRQAAARIRKGTSLYLTRLKELSLDSAGVLALVRDYLPVIGVRAGLHRGNARGGAFLISARIRATISPARIPSLTIQASSRWIASMFVGGSPSSRRAHLRASL